MLASHLANLLDGQLIGPDIEISALRDPEFATANDVVMVRRANFLEKTLKSKAGLIIIAQDIEEKHLDQNKSFIRVKDAEEGWQKLLTIFAPKLDNQGIHPTAFIDPSAEIAENVHIGAMAVISAGAKIGAGTQIMAQAFVGERTIIGQNCQIHQQVTLRHDVVLGDRVLVQAGAVIGADGFGFRIHGPGQYSRLAHIGKVIIGDDVEIGANTVIERATVEASTIGAGSKIGPSCSIAHNCKIGCGVVLIGGVVIAGSTILEDAVTIWGDVAIAGHLTIGTGATVTAKSGVSKSLPGGCIYRGVPAQPIKDQLRMEARLADIENMANRIKNLEKKLNEHS